MVELRRRDLVRLVVIGAALIAMRPAAGLAAAYRRAAPVVGFHNDAPWLDMSGADMPYRPPRGVRVQVPDDESLARLGFFL